MKRQIGRQHEDDGQRVSRYEEITADARGGMTPCRCTPNNVARALYYMQARTCGVGDRPDHTRYQHANAARSANRRQAVVLISKRASGTIGIKRSVTSEAVQRRRSVNAAACER